MSKFKAGKYELIREVQHIQNHCWYEEPVKIDLTAAQAKFLMSNHFYDKLGFKSIELIED